MIEVNPAWGEDSDSSEISNLSDEQLFAMMDEEERLRPTIKHCRRMFVGSDPAMCDPVFLSAGRLSFPHLCE